MFDQLHPEDALEAFRGRLRPFRDLGLEAAYGDGELRERLQLGSDLGQGLVQLFEDFERLEASVGGWIERHVRPPAA